MIARSYSIAHHARPLRRALHLEVVQRKKEMVKISLQLKAQMVNVGELRAEGEDFRWYLKLRCNNCGEETKWVYVTQMERVDVKGGRGTVNLLVKCKMCSRENTLDILTDHKSAYQASDSGNFKKIIAFECRGLEPVAFDPRGGFLVIGDASTSQFTDVSLASKDGWFDYDENTQCEVTITEVEFKFGSLK